MVSFLCRHRKLIFRSAYIDYNKRGALGVCCAIGSGILGYGRCRTDFDSVIADLNYCNTFGNAFNIHPVAVFAGSGIAGATVGCRGHSDMLAAGDYFVIEIRLNHNISGIAVDNLPCTTVGTQAEGFADTEGKLILRIDINKDAAFNTLFHLGAIHLVYGALRIFIIRKSNCKRSGASSQISCLCDLALHGYTVGQVVS